LPEIGRKEFAMLRVLGERDVPLGAAIIARELKSHGIELTERAVRYHLQALDDAGLTESRGRAGRRLTDAGRSELANARVADKVALTFARMEALAYQTAFDLTEGKGQIAINVSLFRRGDFEAAMRVMRPVFRSRYATSDLVAVFEPGQRVAEQFIPRGMVGLGTVCSVTINGILLSHGIPVHSEFGGLLEIAGYEPARFTEVVRYAGTSIDPVEVFIRGRATSVGTAVSTGKGKIGAGFRTCPAVARDHVSRLVEQMSAWRIHGVIAVGAPSRPLLEAEVGVGRAALVVCAGLNPIAAAEEAGYETTSNPMATVLDYANLQQV
jgi:HTH-type transcriptional regulator, global nitrogen regulator NrpRI